MYGQSQITTETLKDLKILERIKQYFTHEMPECTCDNPDVDNIGEGTPIYPVYICRNCGRKLEN